MDYRSLALAALDAAKAITDLAESEKRSLTEDEAAEVAKFEDEARAHVEAAEKEERRADLRAKAASLAVIVKDREEHKPEVRDLNAEFRALARGEVREVAIDFTDADLRTSVTTDPANAGLTAPTTFVPQVVESLRESSDIFSRATVLTTSSGEKMDWPVKNAHVSPIAKVPENTAYGKGNLSFGTIESTVDKYGVIVEVSEEMISDSRLEIASLIASDAGEELGRLAAADAVAALLASAPAGTAFASGTAITADELIGIQHSIVTGYRRNATWVMNDGTALYLRKNLKDSKGDYVWQDANLQNGYDKVLLSRPLDLDPNMPTMGLNANVIVYGDLSKFVIRQVGSIRVSRSDEYGWDRDVVAFKVSWRGGFFLRDAAAVKKFAMGAA